MKIRYCMACGALYHEDHVKKDKEGDYLCPVCRSFLSLPISKDDLEQEADHD